MQPAPLSFIEVNLNKIKHNTSIIKQNIRPGAALMAVVKANAYGHGAVEIARTVLANGASYLAVARLDEGSELRAAGIMAPILVMGYTPPDQVARGIDHDLTLTVTEWAVAAAVSQAAHQTKKTARLHVKVDTGMGRFGLLPNEVVPFFARLATLPSIELEGIFSHFAVADETNNPAAITYTQQQFDTFAAVLTALKTAGYHVPIRHIANSAATLNHSATYYLDAVRVGIALYGLRPNAAIPLSLPLKPVLTLKSRVARVRTLPAGASISYGRTYITPRAMPVALVTVGYGDGYPRLVSNRGAVLINGQRAPIIGRVCMDQMVVDVSGLGTVQVNDEVVLIGCQGQACIKAEDVARWAETINYEVTTALLPRLPRVFW